jgi:hypothetical protein
MASRITSYRPRPRPPHKTPQPKRPRPRIIKPPPDRENFGPTCLRKSALWELTIPLVFNHSDLPRSIGVDAYDAVNDLFLADAFDLVPVAQAHGYGVAGRNHVEGEALDFGEGGLEAVPLRLVLFAAFGFSEGVGEGRVVLDYGD